VILVSNRALSRPGIHDLLLVAVIAVVVLGLATSVAGHAALYAALRPAIAPSLSVHRDHAARADASSDRSAGRRYHVSQAQRQRRIAVFDPRNVSPWRVPPFRSAAGPDPSARAEANPEAREFLAAMTALMHRRGMPITWRRVRRT
jgi:hypothetical protein